MPRTVTATCNPAQRTRPVKISLVFFLPERQLLRDPRHNVNVEELHTA